MSAFPEHDVCRERIRLEMMQAERICTFFSQDRHVAAEVFGPRPQLSLSVPPRPRCGAQGPPTLETLDVYLFDELHHPMPKLQTVGGSRRTQGARKSLQHPPDACTRQQPDDRVKLRQSTRVGTLLADTPHAPHVPGGNSVVMDAAFHWCDFSTTNKGCGPRSSWLRAPHARRLGLKPTSTRKPSPSGGARQPHARARKGELSSAFQELTVTKRPLGIASRCDDVHDDEDNMRGLNIAPSPCKSLDVEARNLKGNNPQSQPWPLTAACGPSFLQQF